MNYTSLSEFSGLSIDVKKSLCTTIYEHALALIEYDEIKIPTISLPVILLRPTIPSTTIIEEDYGSHRVRFFKYIFKDGCTFGENHFNYHWFADYNWEYRSALCQWKSRYDAG